MVPAHNLQLSYKLNVCGPLIVDFHPQIYTYIKYRFVHEGDILSRTASRCISMGYGLDSAMARDMSLYYLYLFISVSL